VKVYDLKAGSDFQSLTLQDQEQWTTLANLDGTSRAAGWIPLRVAPIRDTRREARLPKSDFPTLAPYAPVFSRRASEALFEVLDPYGEWLPLESADGDYVLFNVTSVLNALDLDESTYTLYPSGGINRILTYQFLLPAIDGCAIFRLPRSQSLQILVTERVIERVQAAGLMGFRFDELWTSR
jgi:hypothetical protein